MIVLYVNIFSSLGLRVFLKLTNVIRHLVSILRFDLQLHESPAKKSGNKNVGQGEEHSSRDEEESETIHFAVAVPFQSTWPQPMSGLLHSIEPAALPWVSSQM